MTLDIEIIVIGIGGIISILTFMYGILKASPKKEENNHEVIRLEIEKIKVETENLKKMINGNDQKTVRALERLEDRLQKVTDLLLDHFRKE